jgi:hypothetical protein
MLHLDAKPGFLSPAANFLTLNPVCDAAGQVIGIADMAEDMTERRFPPFVKPDRRGAPSAQIN